MKLLSIETTPSPNCMKLNLDQVMSAKSLTIQAGMAAVEAPDVAKQLLAINGVSSVFLVSNIITITRKNHADWQPILSCDSFSQNFLNRRGERQEQPIFCIDWNRILTIQ